MEALHSATQAAKVREDRDFAPATDAGPVLVAVDLTEDSDNALSWACEHAERVGAPLEILHVIHDRAESPGCYRPETDDVLEPIPDVARRKLAVVISRASEKTPGLGRIEESQQFCVPGLPASTILEVARARKARLVVMGRRHRNGFGRVIYGSTSSAVARKADFPVTIVGPRKR